MASHGQRHGQYDSAQDQEADYSNHNYEEAPSHMASRGDRQQGRIDYGSEQAVGRSSNDRQLQRTRDPRRSSRYSDSEDDSSSESEDRPRKHRSSRSKKRSNNHSQSPIRHAMDKGKEQFSVSNRGAGATLLGAVAGGLAAQEATKGKKKRGTTDKGIGATVVGALIGGLGANALEKKYDDKTRDERRREKDR